MAYFSDTKDYTMKTIKLHQQLLSTLGFSIVAVAVLTPGAMAQSVPQSGAVNARGMQHSSMAKARIGLSGYCPVCIIAKRKWEKGDPQIASTFDGVTYHFPAEPVKAMFDANPEKYVPALSGDCIVCFEKMGKRVPGSVQHAATHNGRLYLFPSDKEKAMYVANPQAFDNTDLAANGECIVCLKKMGKHVPGRPEHTVIHNGMRYLFPSANEADMFRKSPAQFLTAMREMPKREMKPTSVRANASDTVRVAGRSGCAACEFGVTPLTAPDELGLAIVADDGKVTVVENAHQQYPGIYNDRFQGRKLVVEGTILKSSGKISWLRPSSLKVVN